MSRMDNNYTIVLEGENAITYVRITSFIKTKKNVVKADRQLALKKIGIIRNRRNSNYAKFTVSCSDSLYMGIQSKFFILF